MGQQQLLLLVLGIVIVGLAVVVGIQSFGQNQTTSNKDAMISDAARMLSDANAWALKPTAMGGGGGDGDYFINHSILGYPNNENNFYETANGQFDISYDGTVNNFRVMACNNKTALIIEADIDNNMAIETLEFGGVTNCLGQFLPHN